MTTTTSAPAARSPIWAAAAITADPTTTTKPRTVEAVTTKSSPPSPLSLVPSSAKRLDTERKGIGACAVTKDGASIRGAREDWMGDSHHH
jgi:hypothetical protein